MATVPMIGSTLAKNINGDNGGGIIKPPTGIPVLGNTGVSNPNKPVGTPASRYGTPLTQAAQAASSPVPTTTGTSVTATPQTFTGATSTSSTTTNSTTPVSNNPILANYTPQQTSQLQKQLVDIYGKGEGNALFSLINGLGSSNTAYMQAYEKAMAPINAENLATLNTGLGNSGISANSSTAAIADADFESNVTSQEGLQEANLQNQDAQDMIGILQGVQGDAKAETASSWLNTLSDVTGAVGGVLGMFTGNGSNKSLSGSGSGVGSINANTPGESGAETAQMAGDFGSANDIPLEQSTDTTGGISETALSSFLF